MAKEPKLVRSAECKTFGPFVMIDLTTVNVKQAKKDAKAAGKGDKNGKKGKKGKKDKGASQVELVASSVVIIFTSLICVDVFVICLAAHENDRASRDAARAGGTASDRDKALAAAKTSLLAHKPDGFVIQSLALDDAKFVYNPDGLPLPGGKKMPVVSATTDLICRVPVPVPFFEALFNGNQGNNGTFKFSRTYTYPIINVLGNTKTGDFDPTNSTITGEEQANEDCPEEPPPPAPPPPPPGPPPPPSPPPSPPPPAPPPPFNPPPPPGPPPPPAPPPPPPPGGGTGS